MSKFGLKWKLQHAVFFWKEYTNHIYYYTFFFEPYTIFYNLKNSQVSLDFVLLIKLMWPTVRVTWTFHSSWERENVPTTLLFYYSLQTSLNSITKKKMQDVTMDLTLLKTCKTGILLLKVKKLPTFLWICVPSYQVLSEGAFLGALKILAGHFSSWKPLPNNYPVEIEVNMDK